MANRQQQIAAAKTWATGHLVAAAVIALGVGVFLGAILF